ncbi:MAG: helix-turn-helix domain-containing protein [Verrucomicrobia bacterium]|nr:helix-turn-helix domain-containing protein [Verrucomicrobiota bacterium]
MSTRQWHPNQSELNIGIVIRNPFLQSRMNVLEGARTYALEHPQLRVFLIPTADDRAPDRDALARMDGVVMWVGPDDRWAIDLWESGMPVVNCSDAFQGAIPTIANLGVHRQVMDFIAGFDGRCIAYVTSLEVRNGCHNGARRLRESAGDRKKIAYHFDRVGKDPALHPEHMLVGKDEDELERFLNRLPKPAVIWCVHDEMAALVWLKAEKLGYHVPNDLALLGYGDHPCAMHALKGITSVRLNGSRLGAEAVRAVHGHLLGKQRLARDFAMVPEPGATIIQRASTGDTSPSGVAIQRAWSLLENTPPQNLTVKDLVNCSTTSRVHFYAQFTKAFGITPGQAVRNVKLRMAKAALASSNDSITQIGKLCGFEGNGKFNNFIRRETGMTPGALRRILRNHPSFANEPIPTSAKPPKPQRAESKRAKSASPPEE